MNKFKVGDICKVVDASSCANFEDSGSNLIRINRTRGDNNYGYEFLNEKMEGIGNCYGCLKDSDLVLFKGIKGKGRPVSEKIMFIATYDINDVDPHKTFTSRKELIDWLKEAKDDTSIKFSSIKVYAVKKEFKVVTSYRLK